MRPDFLKLAATSIFLSLFVLACGDDDKGGKNPVQVETEDDLSEIACDADHRGEERYVEESEKTFVCQKDDDTWTWVEQSAKSSSSSRGTSSSSEKFSSSSRPISSSADTTIVPPCRNDKIDTCVYGVLTDSRDGRSYKTVVIGNQVWMAENLNYDSGDDMSFCLYANDCETYGRHYEWSAAADSVNTGDGLSDCPVNVKQKGICPDGWHIPSLDEWETLSRSVGRKVASINLRSSEGWENYEKENTKGLNLYGFSVLPSILQNIHGGNSFDQAAFWTSGTEKYCGANYHYEFNGDDSAATKVLSGLVLNYRNAMPVRCLRDEPYDGTLVSDPVSTTTHKTPTIEFYLNPNKTYGEFTDERDGHVYKTIEIDGQTWMAQNLNYETPDGTSLCFKDDEKICESFGRQYRWSVAIDSAKIGIGRSDHIPADSVVQGICPTGWHVPSVNEWGTLLMAAASDSIHSSNDIYFKDAIDKLSSKKLWLQGANHSDDYGLSLLPAFNRIKGIYLTTFGFYDSFGSLSTYTVTLENEWDGRLTLKYQRSSSNLMAMLRCIKDGSEVRYPEKAEKADSCNVNGVDNCEYGTLTDKRDGSTYKTIKIGKQEWMAENLRYADSVKTPSLKNRIRCIEGQEANCEKYGRLYSWFAAMDSARYYTSPKDSLCSCKNICAVERNHQGICPDGWRLPNRIDFEILNKSTDARRYDAGGGVPLASAGEWNELLLRSDSLEANVYGFSVLPTIWDNEPLEKTARTRIWTSTVRYHSSNNPIVFVQFLYGNGRNNTTAPLRWDLYEDGGCRDYMSIRCIKE